MYRDEHPEWDSTQVKEASLAVFVAQRETLNGWYNQQRRYHRKASSIGLDPDMPESADPGI